MNNSENIKKKPKKICIGTFKGGCGKTTFSYSILGYLAQQGYKVLGIDCDPQGNLTFNYRFTKDEIKEYYTVADIFESHLSKKSQKPFEITPEDVVVCNRIKEAPNMDLIPSHKGLSETEMRLISSSSRILIFNNYFEKYSEFFSRYDYIIFDMSPSLNNINQSALYSTDDFILITNTGMNSFEGVRTMIEEWTKIADEFGMDNKVKGVIVNDYDKRLGLSKNFIDFVKSNEDMKNLTFNSIIPHCVKIAETEIVKTPLTYYDTKNIGYDVFISLMEEFKEYEVI